MPEKTNKFKSPSNLILNNINGIDLYNIALYRPMSERRNVETSSKSKEKKIK
jgi:hypothetical protein